MKNFKITIFLLLALVASLQAAFVAVLETGVDPAVKDMVPLTDRQYLTNVLREQAVKELPASQNYTIMTRENITAMLPPGKSIEDCEGSCLAETGKNIAADYVCQARVSSFNGNFTLSAELYETAGNKLVASFNGLGSNLNALLKLIMLKSPEFFRSIKGDSQNAATNKTASPQPGYEYSSHTQPTQGKEYSTQSSNSKETKTTWRRVGFFLHAGIQNVGMGLKFRFSRENGVYMTLDARWLSYQNRNDILFPLMMYLGGNYVHFITGTTIQYSSSNGSSNNLQIPLGLNCDIGRHLGIDALMFAGKNTSYVLDIRFVF